MSGTSRLLGIGVASRRAIAAIGLGFAFVTAPASAGTPAAGAEEQGVAIEGAPAVLETTAEIMARHDRMLLEAPQLTLDFFIGRQDSSGRKVDPDAEGRIQGPASGPQSPSIASGAGPNLPQTVGVNANGPGSGVTPCGTPPDTMGAVGPTQFLSFVNCNIVSFSKSTGLADGVLNTTPNNFFTPVRTVGKGVSDPHVRYDRTSQRWFLSIIDVNFPTNRLLLAVSNTSTITPSTVWTFFFLSTAIGTHTNCLADYPTPGVDANAIYVGVNQFCGATIGAASYAGSDLIVIQKSSVLGAGPIHATSFFNIGSFTPQGVDNADPAATEGYVIATSNLSFSQLDLFRVSSPGSLTPTRSAVVNINTAIQGTPATQPHKGNTGGTGANIDGSDNRLFAATFRDGSLWTAMTVGTTVSAGNCVGTADAVTPTRDAVFWWEFKGIPTGSTPSVNQAGILCDTAAVNPSFYSYATIAPNGQGQAAAGFTIAGSVNFLSAGTAGRLAGDTPSSLQAINVYGPGAAAYNPTFGDSLASGFRRWGDYSFTSLDPCDDQSLWTIQEYVPVANQYGTRFAQLLAPPPATPASANPPSVASGQAAVSVVVTGTSFSGSGFYDTPSSLAGEPCRTRLTSSIPGVTVNSATWNSPTQVTLSLNTTAATAGAKTVTVTNPDGQSANGNILTITSTCTPPATPTANNTGPYCAGSTISLSTPTVPGATYAWTGPNSFTSALQNPTIPNATAASAGAYNVTVTVAGCTSAAGTTNVVVNAVPATPTANNTGPYCAGSTISLSTPTVPGATYAWTGPNSFTSALQNPTIPNATAASAGAYNVTVTVAGCTSAAGTTNVVVNAVPATPTASNTGPYCAGSTISLSTPTIASATYAWTGPNSFTSALQNPTIPNATAANAGSYSVTVTVAGCTSAAGTTNVVVNAVPATPTASNTGPYCAGSTISLSTPTIASATYAWTGPNSFTSALQNPTIPNATAASAGAYNVTVTVAGCTSAAGTTNVVVNAVPATPTANNTGPYCAGSTISLSTPTVPGATYAWTGPNSFTSALQNPTIPNATAASAGAYNVTVTVAGCTSAAGTTNVVVNASLATPTANNTGPYCAGSTISLSTPTVAGATFTWSGPNSFTSALQNPTIANATAANAGAYSVTITVAGCTSAAGTTNVVVNAVPATPTASNTGPYCAGSTISLSTPTVPGATYAWTGPNSFTSALQNPTIPNAAAANAGVYSVTVTVAGCTSAAGTTNVVVNASLATPALTAPSIVGSGSPNRTASVPFHAGSTYSWAIVNGVITAGQTTNQITFTAGTAGIPLTLSVTETSGVCSALGTATVTVAPAGSAVLLYPVTPCRVFDTRNAAGPLGAPSLQPGAARTFDVAASACGIPADAVAISANLAVTNVGALGELVAFPSDVTQPNTSSISFRAGVTRANNAIVSFSKSGATFTVFNNSAAPLDLILDVNGFFR